jgi:hypothetical protein
MKNYQLNRETYNLCAEITAMIPPPQNGGNGYIAGTDNYNMTAKSLLELAGFNFSLSRIKTGLKAKNDNTDNRDFLLIQNLLSVLNPVTTGQTSSLRNFCRVHHNLFHNLFTNAGKLRDDDKEAIMSEYPEHLVPDPEQLPGLCRGLFDYLLKSNDEPPVKAFLFNYELRFMQAFSVGNNLMGWLWQRFILQQWHPFYERLQLETAICKNSSSLTKALHLADKNEHPEPFIIFMLHTLKKTIYKGAKE